jgi:hypothetical protein
VQSDNKNNVRIIKLSSTIVLISFLATFFFYCRRYFQPIAAFAHFPFGVPLLVLRSHDRVTARGPFIIISNANENRILGAATDGARQDNAGPVGRRFT